MRAFMSHVGNRRADDCEGIFGQARARWAEREARAILAETEPREPGDTEHARLRDVAYWRHNARHNAETRSLFGSQIAAHRALADALRAFVQED